MGAHACDLRSVQKRSTIRAVTKPGAECQQYGELVTDDSRHLRERWIGKRTRTELLGSPDFQSWADLSTSYQENVIVRRSNAATSIDDVRGGVFAYNDTCSLSGYLCLFPALPQPERFFRALVPTGGHPASIHAVACGAADAAAIDSNVLAFELERDPVLRTRIRVLASWGPHPIQPVVAQATLPAALREHIGHALLTMHEDGEARQALTTNHVLRFVPVTPTDYGVATAAQVRVA